MLSSLTPGMKCAVALCAIFHSAISHAAEQDNASGLNLVPTVRLLGDSATVATRESISDDWRIVRYGQELPATCWLQTDAIRGSRIEVSAAKLALDAVTRLHLDKDSAKIRLERGRIIIDAGPSQWSVEVGQQRLRIPQGTRVQIARQIAR
jgi:hypothetical protein